jgi:regulator of RNase E activity RraA
MSKQWRFEEMNVVRINKPKKQIPQDIIDRYKSIPTPNISDSMERNYGTPNVHVIGESLNCLKGDNMVGTVFSVKTRPGDNLVVHKALDLVRPGDVLVIDAHGETVNAILGELMSLYGKSKGLAGIVVDGAIRDSHVLSEGDLPIFARGISHQGPFKSGPGELHGLIQIDGTVVNDGDLVVGDFDGLVFVPKERVDVTLELAESIVEKESGIREAIAKGQWDRSWIDSSLQVIEVKE